MRSTAHRRLYLRSGRPSWVMFSGLRSRRWGAYTTAAAGTYGGYDRFGRVTQQAWVDGDYTVHGSNAAVPAVPPIMHEAYTYDRASNRRTRVDARPGAMRADRDEKFEYDGLNRLTEAKRGHTPTSWVPAAGSQEWVLDTLGNWVTTRRDLTGDGDYADGGDAEESRVHNRVNEAEKRSVGLVGGSPVDLPLAYDHAGNTRRSGTGEDAYDRYTHDAWNRLVKHEGVFIGELETYYTIATSAFNGLHWRIATTTGDVLPQERRALCYSAAWQLIEEHVHVDADIFLDQPAYNHVLQEFYGTRYIDDTVLRRVRMPDAYGEGSEPDQWAWESTTDTDFYHITDVQYTTRAMVRAYGKGEVVERVRYTAYGEATHWYPADVNHDGVVDGDDYTALGGKIGYGITHGSYDVDADLNRDGEVSLADEDYRVAWDGRMSPAPGRITDSTALEADPGGVGPDNTFGYCGYAFVKESGLYAVRFRWYDPRMGRWLERDPAGYVDGMGAYQYVSGDPLSSMDALGLSGDPPVPQWHHMIPQGFREKCAKFGINIDDPEWGRVFLEGEHSFNTMHRDWNQALEKMIAELESRGNLTSDALHDAIAKLAASERFRDWFAKSATARHWKLPDT